MIFMMRSSNGDIFRVTGPLCGEFTGPGEFPTQRPVTRSFDVFFDLRLNKRLSKQPWGWWFETPSWSSWRHCNVIGETVKLWPAEQDEANAFITGKSRISLTRGQRSEKRSYSFASWYFRLLSWPKQSRVETIGESLHTCMHNAPNSYIHTSSICYDNTSQFLSDNIQH